MTRKVSADMYPLNELRKKFGARIRSTRFTKSVPRIEVNFKLLTNIVPGLPDNIRGIYSKIIDKAISNIRFFTPEGFHRLEEVDYMFQDENGNIVAVLTSGKDLRLLTPPENGASKGLIAKSPLECRVSTAHLKSYYLEHPDEFPFLDSMACILDDMEIDLNDLGRNLPESVERCLGSDWIQANISECIKELSDLLDKSSFVLKSTHMDNILR